MKRNKHNCLLKFIVQSLILIFSLNSGAPVFAQSDRGATVKPKQTDEKRLALVIGNGAYKKTATLDNPANDATDMAAALKTLGFEVLSGTDQSKREMETLIRDFGEKLAKQGGVGLFFYAGHGLQLGGNNYLVPVEAEIPAEDEVEYAAINLNFLLGKMDAAKNNLNIVILDACRNNPFARSWRNFRDIGDGKGLAKVTPPTGTIMLYATQPGNVASDGSGRNGLFTEALLEQIKKPDVEFDSMVKLLARDVAEKSGKKQLPWKEGIVLGDFYFAGRSGDSPAAGNEPPPPVEIDRNAGEREAWNQIKDSTRRSDFALFVESFPNGVYAAQARAKWELVWWNSIKESTDKADYQGFLKQFPVGQYAGAANFAVKRLETATVANNSNSTPVNNTALSAGTVRKNSSGMELVYIPPGDFMMGSNEYDNEKPIHKVTIKEGFWMGKYEVTQTQYEAVMGTNPSNFKNCQSCPVEQVSWDDAKEFIKKMNAKNDGFIYSLPSEAEWEYAARAGTTTAFAFGDSLSSSQANFDGNYPFGGAAKGQYLEKTTPVGNYQANRWGLYDMHGNVWEWVEDIYNSSYSSLPVDGSANMSVGDSGLRVMRGGSWINSAAGSRSAFRNRNAPAFRDASFGFRVAARPR